MVSSGEIGTAFGISRLMRALRADLARKSSKGIGVDVVAAGAIPATKYTVIAAARTTTAVTAPKKKVFTRSNPPYCYVPRLFIQYQNLEGAWHSCDDGTGVLGRRSRTFHGCTGKINLLSLTIDRQSVRLILRCHRFDDAVLIGRILMNDGHSAIISVEDQPGCWIKGGGIDMRTDWQSRYDFSTIRIRDCHELVAAADK